MIAERFGLKVVLRWEKWTDSLHRLWSLTHGPYGVSKGDSAVCNPPDYKEPVGEMTGEMGASLSHGNS
jgi:hypothetical protein